jgi:hypothetical protein
MNIEYWINAQECGRMAENSLNPNEKAAWLQLARRWLGIQNAGTSPERFEAAEGIGQTDPRKAISSGLAGPCCRSRSEG